MKIQKRLPVKLFMGMISADQSQFEHLECELSKLHGPVDSSSEILPFTHTDYYNKELGSPLWRKFLSFESLIDPQKLYSIKVQTNQIEAALSDSQTEQRTINLDPGYLTMAKLVLASAKDFAHRIYLAEGIYAEVTMSYCHGKFIFHPWTFPDYQSPEYLEYFKKLRVILGRQLAQN